VRLATVRSGEATSAAVAAGDGFALVPPYADVGALLRDGEQGLAAAAAAATTTAPIAVDEASLLQPVLAPGAIVCVGHNYRAHILEMGRELPEHPTLFAKFARALTAPYAEIELPAATAQPDYEAELAFVVGRRGRNVPAAEAWSHIAGLTVLNDVTMRSFQRRTIQWLAGKTWQASTPVGPWLVTPDELPDLDRCEISLRVNGEERQRAALGELVFDLPALVADISRIVELEPGDLIATGTPGGVGHASGRYLRDGDLVEVSVDGIGTLRNRFRAGG
jgi:acylpyruvate hydrolase